MPENSSNQKRRRIDRVAAVLRHFGVADPGGLTDILSEPPFPPIASLEKVLKSFDLRFPPNVSPKFVAQALLASICADSPGTLKWRQIFGAEPRLRSIKTGPAQAAVYHRAIFKALTGIFDGILANGVIERQTNRGIHRVDIMFDNDAKSGFFAEVQRKASLSSNYVPVECKNYTDDLGSAEYDQLSGRLNDEVGRIGLLIFRKIKDRSRALEHLRAKWAKRELLIMIDDADIICMHKARFEGRPSEVDDVLWDKVRHIRLNST